MNGGGHSPAWPASSTGCGRRSPGRERLFAAANDDMERSTEAKTAAVHFLRFELGPERVGALRAGADLALGIDHDALPCRVDVGDDVRGALLRDLD